MRKVVVISGHYQPIHAGHCEYAASAKKFAGEDGLVYCIVNSDKQGILKKGFSFVPEDDRLAVMQSLKYVDKAFISIDTDRTVCKTIQMLCDTMPVGEKPTHFANGGDVTSDAPCPEEPICVQNGIELVYGLGDKIQSSSWILDKSVKEAYHILFNKTT
jgi:D-beta-D-heptose 7-phosphate kinase/D-beta-D-heptose 1-phosphate adenosyltransferase